MRVKETLKKNNISPFGDDISWYEYIFKNVDEKLFPYVLGIINNLLLECRNFDIAYVEDEEWLLEFQTILYKNQSNLIKIASIMNSIDNGELITRYQESIYNTGYRGYNADGTVQQNTNVNAFYSNNKFLNIDIFGDSFKLIYSQIKEEIIGICLIFY